MAAMSRLLKAFCDDSQTGRAVFALSALLTVAVLVIALAVSHHWTEICQIVVK